MPKRIWIRKANMTHTCAVCGKKIPRGTQYAHYLNHEIIKGQHKNSYGHCCASHTVIEIMTIPSLIMIVTKTLKKGNRHVKPR
jgi:hypothetical protein